MCAARRNGPAARVRVRVSLVARMTVARARGGRLSIDGLAVRILSDVLSSSGQDAVLAMLCRLCTTAAEVSGTALMLQSSAGVVDLPGGSDGTAGVADELQLLFNEGPAVDIRHRRTPVLCPDLAADTRRPLFAPAAVVAGFRAAFAVPVLVDDVHLGVFSLYRDTPGDLTDPHLTAALAHTEAATLALQYLQANADDGVLHSFTPDDDQMHIPVASGMIAAQAGVTIDDALQLLRAGHTPPAPHYVSSRPTSPPARHLHPRTDPAHRSVTPDQVGNLTFTGIGVEAVEARRGAGTVLRVRLGAVRRPAL